MSIFKEVTITWEGKAYAIPATSVLRAIAIIEEVITLDELMKYRSRNTAPLGKLAAAYGAVLRYAGAQATDEAVYAAMFDGQAAESAGTAVSALLLMMVPPSAMQRPEEAKVMGNGSAVAAPLSKKRMKPSSVAPPG